MVLIPFNVITGGIPHWLPESSPQNPGRTSIKEFGEFDWRVASPFEPPFPTEAIEWSRGKSAANLVLAGPAVPGLRATFFLTPAGVLGLLKANAFDGPVIKQGIKLMPVKRGQNYLVEAVKK